MKETSFPKLLNKMRFNDLVALRRDRLTMERQSNNQSLVSENIKQDIGSLTRENRTDRLTVLRHFLSNRGFRAIYVFRKRKYHSAKGNLIRHWMWRIMDSTLSGNVFIDEDAEIGPGFMIVHPMAIAIGSCVIGSNCTVYQGVSIGANYRSEDGVSYPIIGDNVKISPGAVILGPVNVGSNVIVGANAVVIQDIPGGSVVGGVPAKIIGEYDPKRFGGLESHQEE